MQARLGHCYFLFGHYNHYDYVSNAMSLLWPYIYDMVCFISALNDPCGSVKQNMFWTSPVQHSRSKLGRDDSRSLPSARRVGRVYDAT